MAQGITFDTGALMALEGNRLRIAKIYRAAREKRRVITVPTVVVAEWVREGVGERARERLLRSMVVEELTRDLAEKAGRVIGQVRGIRPDKGTIDAIVMTSAWLRGDTIFTADLPDMNRIKQGFAPFANLQIEHA
jgi:predicted nucleic acid-binding protein